MNEPPPSAAGRPDGRGGRIDRLLVLMAGSLGGAVVLGLSGRVHWTLDLFAHQQRLYGIGLLVLVIALALRRHWGWGTFAALGLAVTLVRLGPLYIASPEPAEEGASRVTIVSANVLSRNDDHNAVAAAVGDADVVIVMEVDTAWIGALVDRLPNHRLLAAEPREDTFGIALLARTPDRPGVEVVDARVVFLSETARRVPSLEATLRIDGAEAALLAVHPPPPIGSRNANENRVMLDAVAAWSQRMERSGMAHVVVGDLNATPWSWAFRRLEQTTGLTNSQHGFGIGASWPTGAISTLGLGIPIDHVLHSPELTTVDWSLGPEIGSDHYPLRVVLTWRDPGD